ncbi:nesprin-2-like [Heterodontus francisci]|uniref:nesprin-2-like n=1 Tax=Heterodontus francisci TaxID=7792 RepID=UPI00355B1032
MGNKCWPGQRRPYPMNELKKRMEQSWQLWQEFLDDYSQFNDWLQWAEAVSKEPQTSQVLYTEAKEELKKFEYLRKRTEEHMIRLESIKRWYRQLAREQGIGLAGKLKGMVHDGIQRWDNLQRRVDIICKRLKVLQQVITRIREKTDELLMVAQIMLQKSESQDSVTIEGEVRDLLQFQQDVFGQVSRLCKRCLSTGQVSGEWELSNRGGGESDCRCVDSVLEEKGVEGRRSLSMWHPLCEGVPSDHQSGYSTPSSINSLPLEWDSSVDVGESGSHEDDNSFHSSELDKPISLDGKCRVWSSGSHQIHCRAKSSGSHQIHCRAKSSGSHQIHCRAKSDSSTPEQIDVGCQCDSEVNMVSDERGVPCGTRMQAVSDRLSWDLAGDEKPIAEKLRMMNRHCWARQHLDWEPTRVQTKRDHSDWELVQGQSLGPRSRARYVGHWLQRLEPKRKLCERRAATLGMNAGVNRLLHHPSASSVGRGVLRVFPLLPLQCLLAALILSLVLLLTAVVLRAVVLECNWHRRNTFLPFHFTLTYFPGPPPT